MGRAGRKPKFEYYDSPEIIDMCLSCKRPNCTGYCAKYRDANATEHTREPRKPTSHVYDYHGEQLVLSEIAKREGVGFIALWNRVQTGTPLDVAIRRCHGDGRTGKHLMKPVVKIDADGNVLERYESSIEASRHCDITCEGIRRRCRHGLENEFVHYSYTFRYASEIGGDTP